ncbi:hypothetical protein AMRN_1530 [Malaciobacter marinus]|uniref:DUF4145 domain-containing protein n=1 Tax=Malaciobacter marinus TaxID=505249 RepID=A0A347TKY7_9BACT|nr:DUF4145 domain-containing protein [Malaciobacter marinus]AXX87265.1 hypothetical protein AMRN_1530 [Malaciobacter marinus]PHO15522.1 hypothetical protein CPH92_06190 [Malaciobacter marinus]
MSTTDEIKEELDSLIDDQSKLIELATDTDDTIKFGTKYQAWYSRAIKIVEALAPERLEEFGSYYLIDPKRKVMDVSNYVIQDYIKAIGARKNSYGEELWDCNNLIQIRVVNQVQILASLRSRIDSVLQDVTGHLFADLQDKELEAASKLIKASPRAAGALAGVVLERHLQRTADNHGIKLRKKAPTISDLNDPLKEKSVYGLPVWRKIQFLADIRNLCSHQKENEPTKDQVMELIEGVNGVVKTVF